MPESGPVEIPRLNELPTPYEGVTREILFDLFADRPTFIGNILKKLEEENPRVLSLVLDSGLSSIDPERTLDFCLSYYEIFSRTALKSGRKLFLVSDETVLSVFSLVVRELEPVVGSEEELGVMKDIESRKEQETVEEAASSQELGRFWSGVNMYEVNFLASGGHPAKIFTILSTLYSVRKVLYAQEKANKFKSEFKG